MTSPELWAPFVKILTPEVFLPFFVKDLVVHYEENRHPWAQVTVRYYISPGARPVLNVLPDELWWPENRPVRITYGGQRSVTRDFVGYVVSPEIVSDEAGTAPHIAGQMIDIRYTILGATKPLQSTKDKGWTSCTVPYLAREIAGANRLAAITDSHPRVFGHRQQSESDFSFLRRMTQEVGWRLVVDGTTLYTTDPRTPLTSYSPLFRMNSTAGLQDTLLAFRAVTGDLDPSGDMRVEHEAVGLSPTGTITPALATAQRVSSAGRTTAVQARKRSSAFPAYSHTETQAVTDAAVLRNLWWASAEATVDGDVRLSPGGTVRLSGRGLTPQYTGAWMVRSTTHRITVNPANLRLGQYFTDITLGRDQADRLSSTGPLTVRAPSPMLVGGRWVASGAVAQ